jgi:hypothetical protein
MNPLTGNRTIHVSKIIQAPVSFVYNWCTDFREDDNKLSGSKTRRIITQKTKRRIIFISAFKWAGRSRYGVQIVTLQPPNRWHLDYAGEEADEVGDYQLTKLGPRRTKLVMTFKERYKIRGAPARKEETKQTSEAWDRYVAALERDYARSR